MGLADFLRVVLYRKLIIVWSVVLAGVVAAAAGVLLPKKYVSTAIVQVDAVQRNNLTGNIDHRVRVADFLGQQAAVAASRTVALAVIEQLGDQGFLNLADYRERWRRQTGGELVAGNDLDLWAADELLNSLTIEASAQQSTLTVAFRGDEPAQAARIANAFATAYMDVVIEQKKRRSSRNAANFSEETRALAEEVVNAQRDLADFREESGILPIGTNGVESAEMQLATLTARLADARADNTEAQSLRRQAENTPRAELVYFPVPEDALAARQAQLALNETRLRLSRIADRYGETYPDYIEAAQEARDLENRILAGIRDRANFAERRLEALESEAADISTAASAAQSTRDAYDLLKNKVTASQDTFNLLATRSLEEALQSRVDTTDVLLLARGVPPSRPATPPMAVIVALGAVVGAVLGGSIAVFVEFFEGRLRSADMVRSILRAPVIGELDPKALRAPSSRDGALGIAP
ncbi:MAG: GumC family protein [Parvularculaceae bacterium]